MARKTKPLPGGTLDISKMPGHWILARLGKRVLRPGGMELTRRMLVLLEIGSDDDVVEFAPGMGATAREVLKKQPRSYTAVEEDAGALEQVRQWLSGPNQKVIKGQAQDTKLDSETASKVYAEAMLTMQPDITKQRIITEAFRILRPGGFFGIHEVLVGPPDMKIERQQDIRKQLTRSIRHAVFPLIHDGWVTLFKQAGFVVTADATAPMTILEPHRMLQDEGVGNTLRLVFNFLTHGPERKRVLHMRKVFRQFRDHLMGVVFVAQKPETGQSS
jgi:ubiquinone/menaquinone biosynthesis C-methylase UbiE